MDTDAYGRYTVREAAIRLGISEAAVRQRIRRHTLVAERSAGIVYVVLSDATPDSTSFETVDATPDSTAIMPAARQQFEAIRDEWLTPLVAQIAEQAETIGRVTAERDALQVRLSELQTQQTESPVTRVTTPETGVQRAWWRRFWDRS